MPPAIRKHFGRRIRELRLTRDLSQEQLAERAGLHRNYVGGIERGERNVAILNIAKLAAGLDITLAELFAPFTHRPRRH
ncbi:MAG: helix-turn-helix transcriptional regulator [Acidobacteria bacterium]|nr:helix-turn-helix transcriptional regulator [Acidobacteriota bacterium]